MILKRLFPVLLICVALLSIANAQNTAAKDPISKSKIIAAIMSSIDEMHAHARLIFKQDSDLRAKYQQEVLAAQAPGYKSPQQLSQEADKRLSEELSKDDFWRYSHSITDTEFIVNGVKQPDSVFKKYKAITSNRGTHTSAKSLYFHNLILIRMMEDGLLGSDNESLQNMSYAINDNRFAINGKTQPDDVFKKYHAEFAKNMGR